MSTSEVLIFLHEDLPPFMRTELEEYLRMLRGVLTVHTSSGHPPTVTVSYDAVITHPDEILSYVRQRDPHASLPGL